MPGRPQMLQELFYGRNVRSTESEFAPRCREGIVCRPRVPASGSYPATSSLYGLYLTGRWWVGWFFNLKKQWRITPITSSCDY